MGEILAVIGRSFLGSAGLLAATLSLAGCGNDARRHETSGLAKSVIAELKSSLGPRTRGTAATPDPEALASAAMRSFDGPILLAQMDRNAGIFVLGEYGHSADVQTFATQTEQTLILRKGILIGTRGLGDDLMSSRTDSISDLVLARKSGQAVHLYRFLDGEGVERPLPLHCSISRGQAKAFEFAGTAYSTVEMTETCQSGTLGVTNSYWVTGDGIIALSHQWISPRIGHVTIQRVRG
jgi:hypothetical protein